MSRYHPTRCHSAWLWEHLTPLWLGLMLCLSAAGNALAQGDTLTTEQKIQQLSASVAAVQSQMEANQKLLTELQRQLTALQQEVALEHAASRPETATKVEAVKTPEGIAATTKVSTSADEAREREAMNQSQIATLEQTKVETGSKYPFKLSGMVLFNSFVNTRAVDIASSPAYAVPGSGSTGLSFRQTILGFDARGPHLWGASSYADVRADFFAGPSGSGYASGGILRMRTAHAGLRWASSEAFVSLDRSIIAPNTPTSLLAVGQPELAWSGNLWSWNPQIGASRDFSFRGGSHINAQAALIDVQDPKLPNVSSPSSVTRSEHSRWPGTEAHVAYKSGNAGARTTLGIGGYFSPHRTFDEINFNAWAGTADIQLALGKHLEFTVNGYRGQGLGGLGGGGYKDYVYRYQGTTEFTRALEDVGGWTQLKAKAGPRVEWNVGYGLDNPFAKEIHESVAQSGPSSYLGLARNRSIFSNLIFTPSAYLLFSIEYRRLWSDYASGPTYSSDVFGVGAGYRF